MARRRSGKKIDFVHWTPFSNVNLAQAAGSVAKTILAAQHEPETLMRLRGNSTSFLDGVQAPGGAALIAMGIIAVPEGTGTTVLWSPTTDGDAPWIWINSFLLAYEELVTDVIDVPQLASIRAVIDNKSMRILRNQELQFVVENSTVGTAVSINSHVAGRILSGT